MKHIELKVVSGYEFVKKVIEINRFRAGDYLVGAAGGECQWMEFKAVIKVSHNDSVVSSEAAVGKPVRELCEQETERNLQRIAKAIASLYNTRGGCVLIGVCENNNHGVVMPTVVANRVYGGFWNRISNFLKFPFAFFRGWWLVWESRMCLGRMDSLLRLSAAKNVICIRQLYEPVVVFFKGMPVLALIVKCIEVGATGIICESENDTGRLYYRKGACNKFLDWPLTANQANDYDEVRAEAIYNDDLAQNSFASHLSRLISSFVL